MNSEVFVIAGSISGLGYLATFAAIALLFWRLNLGGGWAIAAFLIPSVLTFSSFILGPLAVSQGVFTAAEYTLLASIVGLTVPIFLVILLVRIGLRKSSDDVFR